MKEEKKERDPRRKEKERIDQRGIWEISQKGKESLIKEDIGRRRGGLRGSRSSKASWTRVLFDDD